MQGGRRRRVREAELAQQGTRGADNAADRRLRAAQRPAALVCLITQGLITVTGAVVRVSSSGLGCPTWPRCFADSLVPRSDAMVPWLHQTIEFGNRMLTGVVGLAALAVAVFVTLAHRRKEVLVYGWAMIAGTLAQGVIGGVTVLTGLRWWTVAVHLLASMAMIWLATLLVVKIGRPDDPSAAPDRRPAPNHKLKAAAAVSGALLALVLTAGTLVTGAGPHAGDKSLAKPVARLDLPIIDLARWHGTLALCYAASLVALLVFARSRAESRAARAAVALALAQGAVGVVQYFGGVPALLVVLHVAGAVVVTASTASLWARAGIAQD